MEANRCTRTWALLACLFALTLSACGGSDDTAPAPAAPPPATPPPSAPPTQPSATTTISGPDGASLSFPEGALATPATVRIAKDSTGATPLPSIVVAAGDVYAITPHGAALQRLAIVRVPIDPATPADAPLAIAQADPGGIWRLHTRAVRNGNVLEVAVGRLSLFRAVRLASGVAANGAARRQALNRQQAPNPVWPGIEATAPGFTINGPLLENPVPYAAPGLVPVTLTAHGQDSDGSAFCPQARAIEVGQYNELPTGWVFFGVPYLQRQVVSVQTLAIEPTRAGPWAFDLRVHRPDPRGTPVMYVEVDVECIPPQGASYLVTADRSLTYRLTDPSAIGFLTDPADRSVAAGASASFEVFVAGGATAPSQRDQYRLFWERSDDGGNVWRPIGTSYQLDADATNFARDGRRHVFTLGSLTAADNGALVQARACYAPPGQIEQCVNSNAARLTVVQALVAPVITQQPSSMATLVGQTASFSVAFAGTPTPTVRWQRLASDAMTWIDVGVAGQAPTFTTGPGVLGDTGSLFRAVVSNGAGSVASDAVVWRVSETPVAPTIVVQPQSLSVPLGSPATLAVQAEGTAPLSYSWQRNGVVLRGGGPVLAFPSLSAGDLGSYAVTVRGPGGSVTSSTVTLSESTGGGPPPVAPTITQQPQGQTVPLGMQATFTAAVQATPPATCAWTRNGVAIAGASSCTSYTTPLASSADNGAVFNIVAWNAAGTVFGGGAVLTVQGTAPPAGPWTVLPTGTGSQFSDIAIVDGNPDVAVAVGDGIFRTADGGATWTQIPLALTGSRFFERVRFIGQVGLAVAGQHIMRTTDGGGTWQPVWDRAAIEALYGAQYLHSFDWIDANTAIVVGDSRVFRSTDAGLTWQALGTGTFGMIDVDFQDLQIGIAIEPNRALRTTDGGVTWTPVSIGTLVNPLRRLVHVGTGSYVIVGGYYSFHGYGSGTNWVPTEHPTRFFWGVASRGGETVAVGNNGVTMRSLDAGVTWLEGPDAAFGLLFGVDLMPGGRNYIAGAGGLVARRD